MQLNGIKLMSRKKNNDIIDLSWRSSEKKAWAPTEKLDMIQWGEKYIKLSGSSAEQGAWRVKRTPYLRPLFDWATEMDTETIVLNKSAQVAGTTFLVIASLYHTFQSQCTVLFVLADQKTSKYIAKDRIFKMSSQEILPRGASDEEISFVNGSHVLMAWASSVSGLGSRDCKIVIGDEICKPGYYVKSKEASPISLMRERTESYYEFKVILTSTPTIPDSNMDVEMGSCDAVYDWHVPCPHCGIKQPLRFGRCEEFKDNAYRGLDGEMHNVGQITWQGGRNATQDQIMAAGYTCGTCGKLWSTIQKNDAVEKGIEVPRTQLIDKPRKKGLSVNRLYSLLGKSGSISKIVNNYKNSFNDPGKRQGFENSTLAQSYKEVVLKISESVLEQAKRHSLDPQVAPEGTIALTCGIDNQKYGRYFCVRAWFRDYTSFLIHYGYLDSWIGVEDLLFNTRYPVGKVGSGIDIGIWRVGLDTGGTRLNESVTMTEEVYFWIRNNMGRGCALFPVKGSSNALQGRMKIGKVLDETPSGKPLQGGMRLLLIDTNKAKDAYHYSVTQAICDGTKAAYFHKKTGKDYFSQIRAEQKVKKKGKIVWHAFKKDNHYFDADCIALTLAEPDCPGGGVHLVADDTERRSTDIVDQDGQRGRYRSVQSKWMSKGR
jgi:phage terminase large subunit GpA-like protein